MTPGVEFAETVLTLGGAVLAVVVLAGLALRRVRLRQRRGGAEGVAIAELDERVEALEARAPVTGETDAVYHRMEELEERLEFTERLLAQSRAEGALPRGEER